ncbi:hypothetical protein TorRG33x02_030670 [Trema orientale]|uniref:Uncharacterized protein n=1 Tax=Trema orientale TaxID=63057 RepID=A0A2P5FU40_TREOI|nr:hypothetical protein TorRG33x02_030670 [Trema orientale]
MLEVYRVPLETYPKVGYKTSLYRKALVESQSQLGIEPEILLQGSSSISIFLNLGNGPASCKQPYREFRRLWNPTRIISWQCLIHKVSCEDDYFEAIANHQIPNFPTNRKSVTGIWLSLASCYPPVNCKKD